MQWRADPTRDTALPRLLEDHEQVGKDCSPGFLSGPGDCIDRSRRGHGRIPPPTSDVGDPRLRSGGFGVAGIDVTDDLEHNDRLEQVRSGEMIFRTTGGGLTVSGGEPLMQPAFVGRLLHEAQQLGIHTAIDTSGFLGVNASDALLDDLDLVLLDIKSGIPEVYRKATGRELQPTLDFARRLSERGTEEVWIRFVLVPGLTDAVENVEAVADVVEQISVVTRVEVLPFHQMGRDKWATLDLPYELADTSPPSKELTERVREQFRARGITTY